MTALHLAEAWGLPPWEIMAHEEGGLWAARWACYQNEKHRAEENMRKK